MADEAHRPEIQMREQADDIPGIALQARVALAVIKRRIGQAATRVIEQHHPMPRRKRRRNVFPDRLVAAIAMRQNHRRPLPAKHAKVAIQAVKHPPLPPKVESVVPQR